MYELVIKNGMVLDTLTGAAEKEIGIADGKIAELSSGSLTGKKEIDAANLIISPGFIDIHMHEDPVEGGRIRFDIANFMALMGVTTVVGGNCGIGHWKVSEYLDILDQTGGPVNQLGLMGISGAREAAGCEDQYRPANGAQIRRMCAFVREELGRGAAGVSFGLEYIPGTGTEEMLSICETAAERPEKLVAAHYRFDATRSLEALAEMIIIAREAKVRFEISHIGSCIAFGQMEAGLEMLTAAHAGGVDVMADVYPYNAFCTFIGSAIFDEGCFERWNTGFDSILVASGKHSGQYCDRALFERLRKEEPDALAVAFVMNEEEVTQALRHPLVMVGSDGLFAEGGGHPRAAGAFPRVLGRNVRERKDLDLLTAIRKMTLMPARRLGLTSTGRVAEGFDAYLTLFNPQTVIDRADFMNPRKTPEGIELVLVGGRATVENGSLTGELPGRSIRSY